LFPRVAEHPQPSLQSQLAARLQGRILKLESPRNQANTPAMPIYEFACTRCRKIFNFLSRRVNPSHTPNCPTCGNKKLTKEVSRFAMLKGAPEPATPAGDPGPDEAGGPPMPDFDDPRVERVMNELERDMDHLDENNPRHMAHMLRKMQEAMPAGSVPKEMETALRRLESGEDPEKIEEDMGDVLGEWFGKGEEGAGGGRGGGGYSHDPGLYDY
jgi:putative FmdB family regulatory protein